MLKLSTNTPCSLEELAGRIESLEGVAQVSVVKEAEDYNATEGLSFAEIKAYLDALHSLTVGARMDMIHNGSSLDVWVSVDGKPVRIGAGETRKFS